MAHGPPNTHCIYHGNNAINIKINSPAYKFPYNLKPKEIGFANSSITLRKKLTIKRKGPNGLQNTSTKTPLIPFAAKLYTIMSKKTEIDMAKVKLGSVVGTILIS